VKCSGLSVPWPENVYRLILEEGAIGFARETLLDQGQIRFGDPTEKQKNKLNAIEDLERLRRMIRKVLTAKNWDALLRVQ
jgi:hypothetical protein